MEQAGAEACRATTIPYGNRITAFSELFPIYGHGPGSPLAFLYTGPWCTCRTVPVASSGHSASPAGRLGKPDPERQGNAGEAVDVVAERTGPHSPVKLSGSMPPLAGSFHQRPETGLDLRVGLCPG